MKEPKIRFKGFEGKWEKKKLGAMTSVRGGYAFQSSLFQKYGIPVVRISNILSNGNVGGDFVYYPRLDGDTNITIHEKDVVIAMSGATTGKIARVDVGDEILYQNQRVGLFTKTGKVDYDFLYTVLNRPHFNELLNKLLTSSAQPNASSADIESIEMEIPEDAEEQKALSNYILSLDSLIQSTTKKIESLKQVKAASLQSMFPQEGETTPRVRFKGFEGEWDVDIIGNICNITTGKSNTQDQVQDGKFPFFIRSEKIARSAKYLYNEEAIITIGDGNIGKVFHYIKGKFDLHQRCYMMYAFNNIIHAKYFYYYFAAHFYDRAIKMSAKATVDSVRLDMIANMGIIYPSFAEQRAIASYFTTLDRQITLHTQRLEKLKQIKAACLDNMFV